MLLIVAVLLITVPAMATVTVSGVQEVLVGGEKDCSYVQLRYNCSQGERIRAFALEVTVDSNFTIDGIKDFNVGESNSTKHGGYGIFPAKFRDYIDPTNPNWVDPNYTPLVASTDPDANGTGLGTSKVILEFGSLYSPYTTSISPNEPCSSGMLCRIQIHPKQFGAITGKTMSFVANGTRGGVVDINGNQVTSALTLTPLTLSYPDCFPCWGGYSTPYKAWVSIWKPNCW